MKKQSHFVKYFFVYILIILFLIPEMIAFGPIVYNTIFTPDYVYPLDSSGPYYVVLGAVLITLFCIFMLLWNATHMAKIRDKEEWKEAQKETRREFREDRKRCREYEEGDEDPFDVRRRYTASSRKKYTYDPTYDPKAMKNKRKNSKHGDSVQPRPLFTSEFFNDCNNKKDLKNKFHKLVKVYHPDNMNGDSELMERVNAEYESLKRIL